MCFSFSRIGTVSLLNSGAFLPKIDFQNSRVVGDFILREFTRWRLGAWLDLRNTRVGSLQDIYTQHAWPRQLYLDGFTLDRLGGYGIDAASRFVDRPAERLLEWLERTWGPPEPAGESLWARLPRWITLVWPKYETAPNWARRLFVPQTRNVGYRPSTYRTFANKLRELGQPTDADRLEFASREKERHDATFPRSAGLWLSRWAIGYGIGAGYFWSLFWAFVLAGFCMASGMADGGVQRPVSWWVFACIDHVLPIVSFGKEYSDMLPACLRSWWAKLMFNIATLLSWGIGLMLAAGIAGITQRTK